LVPILFLRNHYIALIPFKTGICKQVNGPLAMTGLFMLSLFVDEFRGIFNIEIVVFFAACMEIESSFSLILEEQEIRRKGG
jgi:hypothetical protein